MTHKAFCKRFECRLPHAGRESCRAKGNRMRMRIETVKSRLELTHKEETKITGPILEEGDSEGLEVDTAVNPPEWRGSLPERCTWATWSL